MNSAELAAFLVANAGATLRGQVKESPLPRLVKKDGRFAPNVPPGNVTQFCR